MSASRLRQSIFPNIPPYLTFIPPDQTYQEGEECPEELVIHFTVAQWSSLTVRDTITRLGARIVEVIELQETNHTYPSSFSTKYLLSRYKLFC